ncbi:hypothetical protein M404DRAFT_205401 [Pisolithus tinctorius Marx 270]|uniref:Uncharacterized protein n=1 Tax=Pisolithus tinctorius Marx 270 TaxID=870435 RepID=A0A0C3Q019_PISTI|nr:hypothetical protein M404DRAFT_205401 [Pisolithus tinctorius Marx 270]
MEVGHGNFGTNDGYNVPATAVLGCTEFPLIRIACHIREEGVHLSGHHAASSWLLYPSLGYTRGRKCTRLKRDMHAHTPPLFKGVFKVMGMPSCTFSQTQNLTPSTIVPSC